MSAAAGVALAPVFLLPLGVACTAPTASGACLRSLYRMQHITLGQSDLRVTPICLGTMTFGEQVNEADSHAILSHSLARGVNFIDTAEMYSVPARAETFGATETIIGNWFAKNPGARRKLVLATKVAGPSRGMPWVRVKARA